jgi:hypothetical protein
MALGRWVDGAIKKEKDGIQSAFPSAYLNVGDTQGGDVGDP